MVEDTVTESESFNESGNATYSGFCRETDDLSDDGKEINSNDADAFNKFMEEFQSKKIINFTVVE